MTEVTRCVEDCEGVSDCDMPGPAGCWVVGMVPEKDGTESDLFSWAGDMGSCARWGGESILRCWGLVPLLPPVLGECWPAAYGERLGEADVSSFEATRVIGGSWGGKGDMGEAEAWLALSMRRGEGK